MAAVAVTMSAAATDWLSATDVTAAGRPGLSAGEVERHLVAQADLEPEESPPSAPSSPPRPRPRRARGEPEGA
ncbi:hypothetical protein ABZP36_023844 [Zizania latifolia]